MEAFCYQIGPLPHNIEEVATKKKKGPRRVLTHAWRSAARKAADESNLSRAKIAKKAGTSGPYFTMLLDGKYDTSTFADALSKALGIETIKVEAGSPTVEKIVTKANNLSDEMARNLLSIIDTMLDSEKKYAPRVHLRISASPIRTMIRQSPVV